MSEDFFQNVPTNEILEARFAFIDNETLRQNVVIYFRYIIFLLNASEEENVGSLKYTLYKDIIIFTASIVESLLLHSVKREVLLGRVDEKVMGYGKKSIQIGKVHEEYLERDGETVEVIKTSKYLKLGSKDRLDFKDINNAAKEAKMLTAKQFKQAESLRSNRNTIHLQTLTKNSDDYFTKESVDEAFTCAHDIIDALEKLYSS